ncbi:MAG: UDP-glucose/GDP-mannose dehydrogenase family protein [Homoserinimonas sp.]
MKLSVIGCGYLGLVHAACMTSLGHDVVGIDVDEEKIRLLSAGEPPFFEPGLPELLDTAMKTGRLTFTTDISAAAASSIHFIAVGTPQMEDSHAANVSYVHSAVESLMPHVRAGHLIVGKSTVPVGTAAQLAIRIRAIEPKATLLWNPEFLREGFAIEDTLMPDRLVYGVPPGAEGERATKLLDSVYAKALSLEVPRIVTDYATSELVKVSANAFLATKISFINAMAEIAEVTGADVTQLADAIGHDKRIGRAFLNSGLGFGGGCLPKDIRAFRARAEELGAGTSVAFLSEVDAINLRRRTKMVSLTEEVLGGSVTGKRVAILGLAFKPNSDDIRDSPALHVANQLHAAGAHVVATDPAAVETARKRFPEFDYAKSVQDATRDADAVLVLTEWSEYRFLLPDALPGVAQRVILDGRNCLDRDLWMEAGWLYRSLGRPSTKSET